MDYRLIRAYCAKDLNGILKRRDKWYSTPESRFDELECQILFKHRAGARCLEPRQYAAAVCLRALELLEMPFEADNDCPEFTQADSVETSRQILADSLAAYVLHLSESESRPLLLAAELDAFTASIAKPQQTAPATDTSTPAPVVQATEPKEQRQDRRLKACIEAGLPMNEKVASLRLPDGVGAVAEREGVSRQSFSSDVKAALKRRDSAKREGVTVHRT